eukprot:COSAG06_NODE_11222_length_1542_cov_1.586279_3_plen_95_part_00
MTLTLAVLGSACTKRHSFLLNFSYVCPEPVLVKIFVIRFKWLKKWRFFFRTVVPIDKVTVGNHLRNPRLQKRLLFFLPSFLTFVPSLSWQMFVV